MMLQDVIEKYEISSFFAYHEIPRDKTVTEFGWISVDEVSLDGPIVISCSESNPNSATALEDYRLYFNKLTSLTPNEFIEKWEPSLRELEVYWKSQYPQAREGQHLFVMRIAYLIRDLTPFEMYGVSFEVFHADKSDEM